MGGVGLEDGGVHAQLEHDGVVVYVLGVEQGELEGEVVVPDLWGGWGYLWFIAGFLFTRVERTDVSTDCV